MAEKYGKKVRELMVKEMQEVFSGSKGFVFSSVENTKASQMDGFRKKMRQSGSKYMIVKNRLAKMNHGVNKVAQGDDRKRHRQHQLA